MAELSPRSQAEGDELSLAIRRVIDSGLFVDGPDVAAFEAEMATYLGVRACVALNSGTDALVIGLRALGVGAGHEVLVPAFSFLATAEAVSAVGARPMFVDIDPRTFNLDPQKLAGALSANTRAILPVHLYGQAAPMDEVLAFAEQHALAVLEDAAQALGGSHRARKLGSWGAAAACSFFPSKNLGAFGDAGLLATNDPSLAQTARSLRQHGRRGTFDSTSVGYNSRLDSLQAAVLRLKLPKLDLAICARREAAARYDALLAPMPGLQIPWRAPLAAHTFHQYTLRIERGRRDRAQAHLAAHGVQSRVYYPVPLHRLSLYREACAGLSLPEAEAACAAVLSLPIWPDIPVSAQERVAKLLRQALAP
jgi:dTDP-4-amino-4,6-dideoxygalactose transaminase